MSGGPGGLTAEALPPKLRRMLQSTLVLRLLVAFALTLAGAHVALAKSIGEVRRDAARDAGGATIEPDGSWTETVERVDGLRMRVGRFPVRLVSPVAGFAGAKRVASCTAEYHDGRYYSLNIGDISIEGMPDVDLNTLGITIGTILEAPLFGGDRVIDFRGADRVPDAKQRWNNVNVVEVPLRIKYRRQIRRTTDGQHFESTLETVQNDLSLLLKNASDDGRGAWSITSVSSKHSEILETAPVKGPPGTILPTWQERAFLAKLDQHKSEIPVFKDKLEACQYAYELLRGEWSDDEVYYVLVQIWDAVPIIGNTGRPFPTAAGEAFLRGILRTRPTLRSSYPAELAVDHIEKFHGRVYFKNQGTGSLGQCQAEPTKAGDTFILFAWEVPPAR